MENQKRHRTTGVQNSVVVRGAGMQKANSTICISFAPEQADLNWENPAVRAELKKVCEFWADRGVDGLRLDVVNLISKDPRYPEDLDGDGRRFYTDGPRAHEFLHEMNRDVFTPRGLMTVGEMSSPALSIASDTRH